MAPYKSEVQKMFDLQMFGMKFGLDGMKSILGKLDNPHKKLKFIHLAGTNGKGSLGAMLERILREAGFRVGFYSSPHLITFRERLKISDEMISEEDVLALSAKVWAACDPASPPTFFEFVTALAFLYFAEKKPDLSIIETGLGGRLDSTNVIEPLLAAISNISLEHVEQLGDTLAKIAFEKAGIIKPGLTVVAGDLPQEALGVIEAKAAEVGSRLLLPVRDYTAEIVSLDAWGRPTLNYSFEGKSYKNLTLALAGPHQASNAAVAITAALALRAKGFLLSEENIRQGLAKAFWPGRAEIVDAFTWPLEGEKAKAPLLMDGAHNPDGAKALAKMLAELKYNKLHIIAGVMADKDITGVFGHFFNMADYLYLSRPEFSRAASPELLRDKIFASFGEPKVPYLLCPSLSKAFRAAADRAAEGDLVLLTGSLFTVGEGRAYLNGINEVESN